MIKLREVRFVLGHHFRVPKKTQSAVIKDLASFGFVSRKDKQTLMVR